MRWSLALILVLLPAPAVAQTVTEFSIPTANSVPTAITAGPDGNLWFTESAANQIGRITPAGVITEFPLPNPGSDPRGITAGPDGALWFTEFEGNRIGRITTAGIVTEFPLPTPASNPIGIAVGSDDAIWFTEVLDNVGRITTSGVITEIPTGLPTQAITAGPDGNLWASAGREGILRISTSGVVTTFPLLVTLDIPTLTAGPDGDVWFPRKQGTLPNVFTFLIQRLTTSGVQDGSATGFIQTLNLPGIASGPDGNVWFTEQDLLGADSVWRCTPGLVLTEFPIPTAHGAPSGIAPGPDGAMWFTEIGNKIGRITTGVAPGGNSFYTVTPCRIGDTRVAGDPIGPSLKSNLTRAIPVAGKCGVPASARAVSLNVTVTQSTSDGHLAFFAGAGAGPIPATSTLNYRSGQTRSNNAILPLGPGATFYAFCGQASGTADLVVDVNGYFQ